MEYLTNAANRQSNPVMYRLAFVNLGQRECKNIVQYLDLLREKAVDGGFSCPSTSSKFDYTDYATRDRLIQGTHNKKTQASLLTNIKTLPTLLDLVKHCKSIKLLKRYNNYERSYC